MIKWNRADDVKLRLHMARKSAIDVATKYAAEWGLACRSARLEQRCRAWWFFGFRSYVVEIDTGSGVARVAMSGDFRVYEADYRPEDGNAYLLPLWAAFPQYTSMTIGWRWCSGEEYKYKWHAWYRGLSVEERVKYRARFPAPTDEERAWEGWYECVADAPASGENPVGEFIIGRV
jgi:hypothetical protein